MRRKRLCLFIALAFGLMPGCRPPQTSPSALLPTLTAIQPVDRATEPVVTSTPSHEPTTIVATSPPGVEMPAATPDLAATVTVLQKPRELASYPSPDGKWRASVIIYDCVKVGEADENAYEQLKIMRLSDSVEQVVDTQLIFCGGLGAYGLKGLFWSSNSRYFYYTTAREGVPDGACGYWEPPFLAFEVTTGNKVMIGMGLRSPDGEKLAAWSGDREIVVWGINTGEIGRVPITAAANVAGPIAWSPDSQALIYLQTMTYCPPRGRSIVGRVDLPDLQHISLIESETPSFEGARWGAPNRIRLFDEAGREWLYDFATKELKPQ